MGASCSGPSATSSRPPRRAPRSASPCRSAPRPGTTASPTPTSSTGRSTHDASPGEPHPMTIAWDRTLLVGDVGGTNARFAIAHMINGKPVLEHHQSFKGADHPTFLGAVEAFIDGCEVKPSAGVIAVAGPVTDGEIDLTNSHWRVS